MISHSVVPPGWERRRDVYGTHSGHLRRVCEAVNTVFVYIYNCIFYVYIYVEEINDPNRVPI